jgi:hypothetical protein
LRLDKAGTTVAARVQATENGWEEGENGELISHGQLGAGGLGCVFC